MYDYEWEYESFWGEQEWRDYDWDFYEDERDYPAPTGDYDFDE